MPGRPLPSPKRYALALWQIARDQGTVDKWLHDLQNLVALAGAPPTAAVLDAPGIPLRERVALVREALPHLNPMAYNLVALLAQRRAFRILPRVLQEFQRLVDAAQGVLRVQVTVGAPLVDREEEEMAERLSRALGRRVVLSVHTDPSLLGGLVLRIGDRVVDGSVRGLLAALRKTLVGVG
jgi:F-type H+-transporting ATPase subunit delta